MPYDWKTAVLADLWKWKKEDRRLAGDALKRGDHPASIRFLAMSETKEEAIQAKLAEQEIQRPGRGQAWYASDMGKDWGRLVPLPLAHGIPDAVREYTCLEGSEYLRRHPEMAEEFLSPAEAYLLTRRRNGPERLCPVRDCGRSVGDCPHAEGQ